MNIEDLIGLLISVIAFIFLAVRSVFRPVVPQEEEDEQEERLVVPPLPPIPQKKMKVKKIIKKEMAASDYEVTGRNQPSAASHIISRLKSKKEMVILHEIIGPPKGRR